MHAELGHHVLGVDQHVEQVRDRRALVAAHISDPGLQQRLGHGQDALAAENLAVAELQRFHFLRKRTFRHSRSSTTRRRHFSRIQSGFCTCSGRKTILNPPALVWGLRCLSWGIRVGAVFLFGCCGLWGSWGVGLYVSGVGGGEVVFGFVACLASPGCSSRLLVTGRRIALEGKCSVRCSGVFLVALVNRRVESDSCWRPSARSSPS